MGYYLELEKVKYGNKREGGELHPTIAGFLKEFDGIFKNPIGLPLERKQDHAIRLVAGSQPPNLHPYHYPYCQKNEIERC